MRWLPLISRSRRAVVVAVVLGCSILPASAGAISPILVINTNDSGPGSLRAAIELANAAPGANTIAFAIPAVDPGFNGQWFTIRPLSALPPLTDGGTTIDGSTQTTFGGDTNTEGPEIEVNGALAPAGTAGFLIPTTDSGIDSLAVTGFPENGVFISGDRNVVSRSYIGADPTGSIVGNSGGIMIARFALSNFLGNTARENRIIGNLIVGNTNYGLSIVGADANVVQGNRIERNTFGGCCSGLSIGAGGGFDLASDNLIGGSGPGEGNVVSGNDKAGIELHNSGPPFFTPGSSGTTIQGNLIGTDASGSAAFGNGFSGIAVEGGENTLIGGTEPGARNLVSGNGGDGIGSGADTVVEGNYIGTNAAGTAALPNGGNGVSGGGLVIGNVISGNGRNGVFVPPGATGVVVQGNLIGTNAAGSAALGNAERGIRVSGADTVIGGTATGEGNVISGNGATGVVVGGTGTIVQGNYIGTNAAGTAALPNGQDGILVVGSDAAIGGGAPGAANTISHNGRFGLLLFGPGGNRVEGNTIAGNVLAGIAVGTGTGDAFSRNGIFGNGGLGIDLGGDGVTANDAGDADTGPNELMNYPVLARAIASPGRLVVIGTIDTPNPETVTIELFANAVPSPGGDPSGHGEGAVFLGTATPNPQGRFVAVLPSVAGGTQISATATDAAGNTSEFAANIAAK